MAESEAIKFNIRERAVKKIADTYLLFDVAVVKSCRQIEDDIFKTAKDENEYFELLARLLLDIQSFVPKRKEEISTTACPDKTTHVTTCLPVVAFSTPIPTATQAKVDGKKQKVIMQHLVRLLCASTCLTKKMQPGLNPNRKCSFPNCELYQEKVQHMMACEQIKECPVPHCSSSRRLLSHWLQCNQMMCLICKPISRLLLIWRAHYDNVFNEGEEDCPDITAITHGVGGISLNIINQPKFNTVLRLMQGISIHENEDLDDVIGVINRMDIGDGMNRSGTSTGGPAVDDFGMGSMLSMLEQISIEDGEFNSMLKLMQTTSLSDAQMPSKNDVTADPEEVEDALNKQHDHIANVKNPVLQHYIKSSIHAYNCVDRNCHIPSCKRAQQMIEISKDWKPDAENRFKFFKHFVAMICIHASDCQDSRCPLHVCHKIRELYRYVKKGKTKSHICVLQASPQSQMIGKLSCRPIHRINHHRHVPYVVLRDTSQHYPQQGVRHQVPHSYISRVVCPLKPSPIRGPGISSNSLNIQAQTKVHELINLTKTPEQAQRILNALNNIGKPNNSFFQHLQQELKKSILRASQEYSAKGRASQELKFQLQRLTYLKISDQLDTSFTSMSIKPTEQMEHHLEKEKGKIE